MIRILIVEDSPTAAFMLSKIFASDPELQVLDIVSTGKDAIKKVEALKPDIISMDVELPDINGLEVTRHIMSNHPTPIVIVSGDTSPSQVDLSFRALEAGALAAIPKPQIQNAEALEKLRNELIFTFKAMSEIKVIRRRSKPIESPQPKIVETSQKSTMKMIAIGSSTGGPQALQELLKNLPAGFPVPIVIVQHISPGFTEGLVKWLSLSCEIPIHLACNDMVLRKGNVYIAPEGQHLSITADNKIKLVLGEKEHGVCPSVSYFFRSVITQYGSAAAGIILSGMGKDGAVELKSLKDLGGITFAQNQETCVVHGMPGEAIRLGGAMYIQQPSDIAHTLCNLVLA